MVGHWQIQQGVVDNVLLDVALLNTLFGVNVNLLASPLGCREALDFSKIFLETPLAKFAPKPEPPKTVGVEVPVLFPFSLSITACPSSSHHRPTMVMSDIGSGADEALKPDAKPPESGPNDNLGISVPAPLGLSASKVSANFDAAVASLPEPNTDVDLG